MTNDSLAHCSVESISTDLKKRSKEFFPWTGKEQRGLVGQKNGHKNYMVLKLHSNFKIYSETM